MKTLSDLKIAEVELIYKTKVKPSERPKITNSAQSYEALKAAFDQDKIEHVEMFYILLLNRNNKVLGVKKISEGGTTATVCDPKVIFQTALKVNASGIILAHNHPSGSLTASDKDRSMTKRLCEGAKILDIQILDHIILSPENTYLSFSDEGLM